MFGGYVYTNRTIKNSRRLSKIRGRGRIKKTRRRITRH